MAGGEKGFTILEILISAVILTVVSFAVVPILLESRKGNMASAMELEATFLATGLIETVRAMPYEDVPVVEEGTQPPGVKDTEISLLRKKDGTPATEPVVEPAPEPYTRYLWISEITEDTERDKYGPVKSVVVTVTWPGPGQKEPSRSVVLRAMLSGEK